MPTLSALDPAFLAKLEALELSVRQVRWGSRLGGRFTISRRGSSIEFADYAAYTPGDDIRSIDWNLYARLDRLFVKTYKEDIELAVEVIIDATASMALPTSEKFARTCWLGLCLAYIALAGHHQVRMSWIKPGQPHATSWCAHRGDVMRFTQWASGVSPEGHVRLHEWMHKAITQLRMRGGQALIISDGMHHPADCFKALHLLLRRHLEIKFIQVLSPQEFDPARLFKGAIVVDSETHVTHELAYRPEELARAVLEHNEQLARFCKRHGILLAQHRLDEPPEEFVLKTLPARGFLE
jgi:uncharacterized protein (DUF58 family)